MFALEDNDMEILPEFDLADVCEFDPNIFMSDNLEEQCINNFILTLAIIYNDFKNILWAYNNLDRAGCFKESDGKDKICGYNGQYAGFKTHIERLMYAMIRELHELIWKNRELLKTREFIFIESKLSKEAKKEWNTFIDFCINKKDNKRHAFCTLFERIRNNVTYHYCNADGDMKEIGKGYKHFFSYIKKGMPAYVSRTGRKGDMRYKRFYFADAAMSGYMHMISSGGHTSNPELNTFIAAIASPIYEIVDKFINSKTAFRKSEI